VFSLYFFTYFSPFFLLIGLIVLLLAKRPDVVLNKKVSVILFLIGLILSPVVTGHIFYPDSPPPVVTYYLNYLVIYLIIPSLIATQVLSRAFSRKDALGLFVLLLLFEGFAMSYRLPFGFHPPQEPAIKLEISRSTMVFGDLTIYFIAVGVPTLLCHICTRIKNPSLRIVALLAIPISLILVYVEVGYLTGGVI